MSYGIAAWNDDTSRQEAATLATTEPFSCLFARFQIQSRKNADSPETMMYLVCGQAIQSHTKP